MPALLEKTNNTDATLQKLATNIAVGIAELTDNFETQPTSSIKDKLKQMIVNTKWILTRTDQKLSGIQFKIIQYQEVTKIIETKEHALFQAINLAKSLLNETQKIAPKSKALTTYANAITKAEKLLNLN